MSTQTNSLDWPDTLHNNGMFKKCSMTVFLHDYATPPSERFTILPFITMQGKSKEPVPVQIYSIWTLELIRTLSNEQIGKLVRETLNKLEDYKQQIENQ